MHKRTLLRICIIIFIGVAAGYSVRILLEKKPIYGQSTSEKEIRGMGPTLESSVKPENTKLKQAFRAELKDVEGKYPLIPESFFEKSYDAYGSGVMIDVLDENPTCHVQAHNLGRVIYEHTKNLVPSLAVCQNKCNQGCIHGVLMGMFKTPVNESDPSPASMTPNMQKAVADTCSNPDILKYESVGNCYHAVGHVIASLVYGDSTKAIGLCESVFRAKGLGAIFYCATGVYMQQDITVVVEGTEGTKSLACDTSPYPAACYRYQLYHQYPLPSGYTEAIAHCLTMKGTQRSGCFNGLGVDAYWMVYRDPAALNQLCAAGDDTDRRMCVEGVFALLNVYYPDASPKVCGLYTAGDAAMCTRASKLSNFSMKYDFSLYAR